MKTNLVANTYSKYSHLEAIFDGVILFDSTSQVLFINSAMERISGYKLSEFLSTEWRSLTTENFQTIREDKNRVISISETDNSLEYERIIQTKAGKKIWIRSTYTYLKEGITMNIVRDISIEKNWSESIEQLKVQNTILSQELQHRVKNNMQIVISLLNLQFQFITDNQANQALAKSKDRMIAISHIHNYLCFSENLSVNCFGAYLNKLLRLIEKKHCNGRKIKLKVNFLNNFINVDHLVSLGLIITELVTNAYKHAFSLKKEGTITVSLNCEKDGKVILNVMDNGDGIQSPLNLEKPTTLGYEIIILLVHQIEGRLCLSSESGTNINVVYYQEN